MSSRLTNSGNLGFRIVARNVIHGAGLLLLMLSPPAGCTRCDHSSPPDPPSSGPSPVPSQLLAKAGRLGPILARNSAECLACAETNCQDRIDKCLSIAGIASAGPAQGTAKSQLCAETLDCVVKSRCVEAGSGRNCYCGSTKGLDCISPQANGSCKSKLEASLETTTPSEISGKYGDEQRGGGAAMQLVQCLINHDCERCF